VSDIILFVAVPLAFAVGLALGWRAGLVAGRDEAITAIEEFAQKEMAKYVASGHCAKRREGK
jgi:hypothetical protein